MTRQASGRAENSGIQTELIRELNKLGFVLVTGAPTYSLARTAVGNELELTLAPLGSEVWRVGLKWRPLGGPGRASHVLAPMSLGRLGESSDGVTIDLPGKSLTEILPRLLAEGILPRVDLAPGTDG